MQTHRWEDILTDSNHLRLLPGNDHPTRGLRWEIINLGANQGFEGGPPANNGRHRDSAHAGVMAAAAHFPSWWEAMDQWKVPYAFMGGYRVWPRRYKYAFRHMPFIGHDGAKVDLGAYSGSQTFPGFSVPVIERVIA